MDAVALRLRAAQVDRARRRGRMEFRTGSDRRRRVREGGDHGVRLRHTRGPEKTIAASSARPPTMMTTSSQTGVPPSPPPSALGSGGTLRPASLATATVAAFAIPSAPSPISILRTIAFSGSTDVLYW